MSTLAINLKFDVSGDNFAQAGNASEAMRSYLKKLGIPPSDIRRASIAMYEGEINMVIHADGGKAFVDIYPDKVDIVLEDRGPGIANIEKAMEPGFTTAKDSVRTLGFGAGMGLPNMKKYTDNMVIESTVGVGRKVSMTIIFGK